MHQRPFRAARDILGPEFVIGVGGNPAVDKIQDDYARLIPEVNSAWPGMGIGLAASVDRVRKFVAPVGFGRVRIDAWSVLGFDSPEAWWDWCRKDHAIAAETGLAVADVLDMSYGLKEGSRDPEARTLWRMATSNLEDVANNLPNAFNVDSVIQPICLIVELSLKALLVEKGAKTVADLKGKVGHDLAKLAELAAAASPHRDDGLVADVVANLPAYVASRYSPAGLTRLNVVRLALGAQFVAASTARRISGRDMAGDFEASPFPGPRQSLFAP